jgi:hypothetical protein
MAPRAGVGGVYQIKGLGCQTGIQSNFDPQRFPGDLSNQPEVKPARGMMNSRRFIRSPRRRGRAWLDSYGSAGGNSERSLRREADGLQVARYWVWDITGRRGMLS